jgi:hypothetical protein
MNLRRRKSKQQQAADLLADYLKLEAVSKTAKRTPLIKRIPIVLLGAAAATFAAVKLIGGGGDDSAPAGA